MLYFSVFVPGRKLLSITLFFHVQRAIQRVDSLLGGHMDTPTQLPKWSYTANGLPEAPTMECVLYVLHRNTTLREQTGAESMWDFCYDNSPTFITNCLQVAGVAYTRIKNARKSSPTRTLLGVMIIAIIQAVIYEMAPDEYLQMQNDFMQRKIKELASTTS